MYFSNEQIVDFATNLVQKLNDTVFHNLYKYLEGNPQARKNLHPAFPFPRQVRVGVINGFLLVEYVGPEQEETEQFATEIYYEPEDTIYKFLDMDLSAISCPVLASDISLQNLNFFLGKSIEYLCDYFYDFTQMKEDMILNGVVDLEKTTQPIILNNCTYFYTDANDALKVRHIDLLEIFPFVDEGIPYHTEISLRNFTNYIISNKFPSYDVKLHKVLNEFIQLINLENTNEPDITSFVERNPELLQLTFGFNKLNPQKSLEWQDRVGRNNLRPDFLPQDMSGYCQILDFKLPRLSSKPIVGRPERRHPSYEIDEVVAQLDTYEEYCSQYLNRQWLLSSYGVKIESPRKFVVMGHSEEFSAEDRQRIRRQRDTTFFTYDEMIEMARFQLYRIR